MLRSVAKFQWLAPLVGDCKFEEMPPLWTSIGVSVVGPAGRGLVSVVGPAGRGLQDYGEACAVIGAACFSGWPRW